MASSNKGCLTLEVHFDIKNNPHGDAFIILGSSFSLQEDSEGLHLLQHAHFLLDGFSPEMIAILFVQLVSMGNVPWNFYTVLVSVLLFSRACSANPPISLCQYRWCPVRESFSDINSLSAAYFATG